MQSIRILAKRAAVMIAALTMVVVAGTTWLGAGPALAAPAKIAAATLPAGSGGDDVEHAEHAAPKRKAVSGKLNLNTATEDQLVMLPGVGPSKAERVVTWRQKHGAFKRVADLRHVKGFGYKTIKKLEPYLDIKGESTLKAE
jgi:competence protein ComEA